MYAKTRSTLVTAVVFLSLVLIACGENKQPVPKNEVQVKSTAVMPEEETAKAPEVVPESNPEQKPAIATITAPDYVVEIHEAIAFLPKEDGLDAIKVKNGYRYVVLDMSVKNTSSNKEVDFAQILLSSKVRDEKGREYNMNVRAIAAYTLDNPDPKHHAQYNAIWNKLKPGDYYRTTAYGLEVPTHAKNFVIIMKEDGDLFKEGKSKQAKFSVE